MCFQPGGDPAEAQWGTHVVRAGDGRQKGGVRDERRAGRPYPWETDPPHLWRHGEADSMEV